MSLDQLWAGWRSGYVSSVTDGDALAPAEELEDGDHPECVFCAIVSSGEPDEVRHVVSTGHLTTVLMNAYPYTTGHLLVMPLRHVAEFEDLSPGETSELWSTVTEAVTALRSAYSPDGMNVGVNLGRTAGAGILGHLHVHVLPRWLGDTNFMTSVASVRVIPESLGDSCTKIRNAWPLVRTTSDTPATPR